jgi:hypothetical protein
MTVFPLENTSLVALAQALAMLIICGGGFGWQRTGMGQVLAPLMSAIGPHDFLRRECLLLTQSGHGCRV